MKANCKTCSKDIYLEPISCPNCGDTDPTYFKLLKKIKNKSIIFRTIITFLALILIYIETTSTNSGNQVIYIIVGCVIINILISLYYNKQIKQTYNLAILLAIDEEAKNNIKKVFKKGYE